jgi:RimJ/RimL family protein N-acetyltransferase
MGRWAADERQPGSLLESFAIIPIEGSDDIQLGYAFLKENWEKDLRRNWTRAGLDYYFKNTNADHIYAIAEEGNIASHKVLLEKFICAGWNEEGR